MELKAKARWYSLILCVASMGVLCGGCPPVSDCTDDTPADCNPSASQLTCEDTASFSTTILTVGGNGVRGVALARIDADCDPDIVLARDASQRVVQMLISDGQGGFGTPLDFEGPGGGFVAAAADLDGNGWSDVLVTTQDDDKLYVLYNDNLACLPPVTLDLATQANPLGIALGDFDNDDRPDIAVANLSDESISVFLGRPARAFADPIVFSAGPKPRYLAAADFDQDGCLDLAVAKNDYPVGVQVYRGQCDGTFVHLLELQVGEQVPGRVAVSLAGMAVADLNGDGLSDLVMTDEYQHNAYGLTSNGDGSFDASDPQAVGEDPQGVAIGDLNNDGLDDLAVAAQRERQINLLLSNGDGTFLRSDIALADSPSQIAAADLDRDGDIDLVASHEAGKVIVLTNRCGE